MEGGCDGIWIKWLVFLLCTMHRRETWGGYTQPGARRRGARTMVIRPLPQISVQVYSTGTMTELPNRLIRIHLV